MTSSKVLSLVPQPLTPSADGALVPLGHLLAAIDAGDSRALDRFYERTVATTWRVAVALLGAADAEEVVEDVYLYVWHHPDAYDPARGSVAAWLTTLCRSRAIDRWRAQQRRTRLTDSLDYEDAAVTVEVELEDDAIPTLRQNSRLAQALAALSEPQRQTVALAYFRGLTHQEIAAHLSMKLGTVKTHLRRALAVLREALDP